MEIEKEAKRFEKPGPGQYEGKVNTKIMGAYNLKEPKSSFIDEAEYLGLSNPSFYECKYDIVSSYRKSPKVKIAPTTKHKEENKDSKENSPSPVTYEVERSFKNT